MKRKAAAILDPLEKEMEMEEKIKRIDTRLSMLGVHVGYDQGVVDSYYFAPAHITSITYIGNNGENTITITTDDGKSEVFYMGINFDFDRWAELENALCCLNSKGVMITDKSFRNLHLPERCREWLKNNDPVDPTEIECDKALEIKANPRCTKESIVEAFKKKEWKNIEGDNEGIFWYSPENSIHVSLSTDEWFTFDLLALCNIPEISYSDCWFVEDGNTLLLRTPYGDIIL